VERAPVDRNEVVGAEILESLNGLFRVDVDGFHEPAGFVGAGGKQRYLRSAEPFADFSEVGGIAGVPAVVQAGVALVAFNVPASPERAVTAEDSPTREALCRRAVKSKPLDVDVLPPAELDDSSASDVTNDVAHAERYDEEWRVILFE